jgi:hypothetical protein
MSEETGSELFDLPEGGRVATGLLLPVAGETLPVFSEFPDELNLDDKDIEKALKGDFYLSERKRFLRWMINQSTIGKCAASAAVGGMYQVRENNGFPHVPLADNQLYWRTNGGSDSGSILAHGMKAIQDGGVSSRFIEIDGRKHRIGDTVYNTRQVDGELVRAAAEDAKRFRAFECFRVPKQLDKFQRCIASALARRYPVVFAWHVGAGSMRLRNGYAVCGNGPGNHANVWQSAKWVGGTDLVHPDNRNSWGPSQNPIYGPMGSGWGDNGFALFTMSDAFRCIQYHDFYVFTSVMSDPKDPILS